MIVALLGLAYAVSVPTVDVIPLREAPARTSAAMSRSVRMTATAPHDAAVTTMLRSLNAARAARGLRLLALDARLCRIARSHAVDMIARRYFGHTSPEGESPFDRMKQANYRFGFAGENLALDRSPDAAQNALWNSIEHRDNMLEPHYTRVGIAVEPSADGEIFVEDFSD